ncbi:class I SAM-dependent methyltransferase [Gluconacetobacter diazotrophicus]|uniref:Putative methyltransferase protein n=1 Tax=Gluconacetobacter diazotrophicus (strain ATCC 49037 / DSM 5601 / CCUG 37298 / CIP 103539 / LMG 7603 / PAl5) TaxID=272568 RepID=A9HM35_GLUDA|nr:methyltransferase domain-containing protein [Gluconacetobacter diazotrophicus]CAP56251.1 putative methyltransferase protein [Gluconacetobacter diazotrophicus PA1 5]
MGLDFPPDLSHVRGMTDEPHGFHPAAFTVASDEPDASFFARRDPGPLMDPGAQSAVTALYHTLVAEGADVLDLMAGPDSHLPRDATYGSVIGIGLDADAMADNPRIGHRIVQDLNATPTLPLPDDAVDVACLCDVAPYLRQPMATLAEIRRVLRPGGVVIVTFSDRVIAGKAVALWQALDSTDRRRLLTILLQRAGFAGIDSGEVHPPADTPSWRDTVYAITARVPNAA